MNLKVERAVKYDGDLPKYHLPIEIGDFSLNSEGKFCNDRHQLKYLIMPSKLRGLHMDLEEGYSQYIHESEESQRDFRMILRWIVTHQDQVKKHFMNRFTSRPNIDFICFNGTLTKICSSVYERRKDWLIVASKYKSTIYLATSTTELELETNKILSEKHMNTWGFKFEQYMTSDKMNSIPNTSVPVNENEKFYAVMKGKFGNYSLLIGNEVDAVDPAHFDDFGHDPTSVLRYVELKTSRRIEFERQERNFRRNKLLQWYLQSYFAGIPRIICGFRDDAGIVRELGLFNVRDIPKMSNGMWSPAPCLNFGIRFFDFLKQSVVKEYPTDYMCYYNPGLEITCEEIPRTRSMLSKWYTDNITFA